MNIRIGQAWSALNKVMKVWRSNLKNHLKVGFFRATVESVLLYGAECWTMTGKMRNRLDGTYTRMLRAVLGVSWKEHKTNKELYGNLPKITDTLMIRRLRFIGHLEKKGWGDKLTTTLRTNARRKKDRKTSINICRAAAKWYWFEHCWTEERHGKPEGMDEAS